MSRSRCKVVMLGLDAADAGLIQRWTQEGYLPVFQQLIRGGAFGELTTTTDLAHTSVWPTLFTGTSPGEHGIYNFFQLHEGSYDTFRVWASDRTRANLWEYLDRAGKTCIVLDAPFDCPIDGFRGTQLMEWGTWVRYWKQEGTPHGLWTQLLDHFPLPPIEPGAIVRQDKHHELRRLCDWLREGAALKSQSVRWLMAEQEWDLFVAVFPEPHPAGHYFWNLDPLDSSSPSGGSPSVYLRDVYAAVDRAIGEILSDLDQETTIIILSGDGMGPNYSGWHFLPDILRRLGFLVVRGGNFSEGSGGAVVSQNGFLHQIRNRIPGNIRMSISKLLPDSVRMRLWQHWSRIPVDWACTRAYFIPNECQGHIRINLKGRDPSGSVDPGAEYDKVCDELSERLLEITSPQTGARAVQTVVRTDDVFPGAMRSCLPDLILVWNEKARVTTEIYSEACGLMTKPHSACDLSPYYVGNHRSPGFMVARTPRTCPGAKLEKRDIIDLAPTLLNMFDISRPQTMNGQIWADI